MLHNLLRQSMWYVVVVEWADLVCFATCSPQKGYCSTQPFLEECSLKYIPTFCTTNGKPNIQLSGKTCYLCYCVTILQHLRLINRTRQQRCHLAVNEQIFVNSVPM